MSNFRPSRNVVPAGEVEIKGRFLDQLKTIHAVAEESPAARWTKEEIRKRYQMAHAEGRAAGLSEGFAEGHALGLEEGRQEGAREARAEFDQAHADEIARFTRDLDELAQKTRRDTEEWYERAEQKLSSLAIEIARRALGRELDITFDAVVDIAKQVLGEVTAGTHVRLRVNPVQTATLDSRREEILASLAHIRDLEIIADPSVQAGVIAEGDGGVIDARIESYLDRLLEDLEEDAA